MMGRKTLREVRAELEAAVAGRPVAGAEDAAGEVAKALARFLGRERPVPAAPAARPTSQPEDLPASRPA